VNVNRFDIETPIVIVNQQVRIHVGPWSAVPNKDSHIVVVNERPIGLPMPQEKAEALARYLRDSLPDILKILSGAGLEVFPATTREVLGGVGENVERS
jgi:hypothetical protein